MDFARKRKLNALLNGLGSRPSPAASDTDTHTPAEGLDSASPPRTPPSHRNSTSSIHTPGSDSMALRHSFSSLPKSSSSISTADLDLLTKRRRLGLPGSTPSKNLAASSPAPAPVNANVNGNTTISNIVLRKWGAKDDKKAIFKPKYCPADRDELLRRLATFQELTDWTPKPDPVNEVQWAKRGWICNGKERVRCTLCNKELVVRLNRKDVDGKEVAVLVPSDIEDALVNKYLELILTSHQDDCLWRKRGCDESLLRLPLSNRQAAILDLRKRYDELCFRKAFLPYEFNLRLPEKLSIDAVLAQLPPDFFTSPPPPQTNPPASAPNRVALALAVMGWQGLDNPRIGPVPNTASCHTCLRRLGLWMFKSKEVDPETNEVLVPAPMACLEPVREHRFFCPWKSAEVQRNRPDAASARRASSSVEQEMAGWEVLVQVIKNEAYLRNRDTPRKRQGSGPPQTPRHSFFGGGDRGAAAAGQDSPHGSTPGRESIGEGVEEVEEDGKTLAEEDKARWARLRKVKSLLSGKGTRKLRKSFTSSRPGSSALSRPGTSHSTAQGDGSAVRESMDIISPPAAAEPRN